MHTRRLDRSEMIPLILRIVSTLLPVIRYLLIFTITVSPRKSEVIEDLQLRITAIRISVGFVLESGKIIKFRITEDLLLGDKLESNLENNC